MSIRDFSDEEMRLLARVIRREQQTVRNPPSHQPEESQDYLTPERYIAAIGEAGSIPGLTPATGSDTIYDAPGSVECDIYRISNGLLVPAGFTKRVYNLSTRTITSDWFTVSRDKYGVWLVDSSNGGGKVTRLIVQTESWDTDLLGGGPGAICKVLWKNDEATIPSLTIAAGTGTGTDSFLRVPVYDTAGCVFIDSPSLLLNRIAWADFMIPADQVTPWELTDDLTGRWHSSGLCCD